MLTPLEEDFFNAVKNDKKTEIIKLMQSTDGLRLLHVVDQNGMTALHHAAARGLSDIINILIYYGAPKEYLANDEKTPLVLAIINNHLEVVKLLIHYKVDINGIHTLDFVPLYYALIYNRADIVSELINNGVDLNIKDIDIDDVSSERKLVWLERCTGQRGISEPFYYILKAGLFADSIYYGKINEVVRYINENIKIQDALPRLETICKMQVSFGDFMIKPEIFPPLIRPYLKQCVDNLSCSNTDLVSAIEKPLACILNKLFPAYFPSEEAYSNLLKTRKDHNTYNLSRNLQSYIKHPIYQPYHFFQALFKDENLKDIIRIFIQCPNEASMLLANLKMLLILPEFRSKIESFEQEFRNKLISSQMTQPANKPADRGMILEDYMRHIDHLYNALDAQQNTLNDLLTIISNNNYAASPDSSNTPIKGKFTAEILNSKVRAQERY